MIEIIPLTGLPEIRAGDDLTALFLAALVAHDLRSGDILVVTSKIVSKAEGRMIALSTIEPGAHARDIAATIGKDPRLVELVLRESSAVIRVAPGVLITRHRLGHVMANAGIDASNLGNDAQDRALLLPLDPDASAQAIAEGVAVRFGFAPAVIISDSFGRPWRMGVTNVAIGCAGIPSIIDQRGKPDRDGRPMQVTQVALADLIAAAAGLAMGEGAEGIPAVLVRGLDLHGDPLPATALIRPLAEDLFT